MNPLLSTECSLAKLEKVTARNLDSKDAEGEEETKADEEELSLPLHIDLSDDMNQKKMAKNQ